MRTARASAWSAWITTGALLTVFLASVPGMASAAPADRAPALDAPVAKPTATKPVSDIRGRAPSGDVDPPHDHGIHVLPDLCTSSMPAGLVGFEGPGGVRMVARAVGSGNTKVLHVVSASGSIGGFQIHARDVSGALTWKRSAASGSMSGSLRIDLPDHVAISRTWAQKVWVSAQPQGCAWKSAVILRAKGAGASLGMRGPLAHDGSYELRGGGSVHISQTTIPISGWLRSAEKAGHQGGCTLRLARAATWRIEGEAQREVRLPGAAVRNIRLLLTPSTPVPSGTGVLSLSSPALNAPATVRIPGSRTWTAQVSGSDRRTWIMPASGMVVHTGGLTGSLGMRAGRPTWRLSASGAVSIGTVDYLTNVGFTGPGAYSVRATSAAGSFPGTTERRLFQGLPSKLMITAKGLSGALSVSMAGDLLLDMPSSWSASTAYILRPVPQGGWAFTSSISHALKAGKGTIRLSGPISQSGRVDLVASGSVEVSGTKVPARGYYRRANLAATSVPVWSIAAYIAEAPRGRIPLDGGAGIVGGTLDFHGAGAQPISTIPALREGNATRVGRAATARTTPIVTGGNTLTTVATESFVYPAGYLAGANGGTGWSNAWSKTYSSGGADNVQATGLNYGDLSTAGGSLLSPASSGGVFGYGRVLTTPMSSGVVYLQFLSSFGTQTGQGTPSVRLLNSSTGALSGGLGNNGQPNMAILDSSLNPVATSATSMNGLLLNVVKLDYNANTTSLWVNPDLSTFDYGNPPAPDAMKSGFSPAFDRIDVYTRGGQAFDEITIMTLSGPAPLPDAVSITTTGATVQLSDSNDDTFYLPVTGSYTDQDNWTMTAAGTDVSNRYTPFTGLAISETDFVGTVTDTSGTQTWNVTISEQGWTDMAQGMNYTGGFTITNVCPRSDEQCPENPAIFINTNAEVSASTASATAEDIDGTSVPAGTPQLSFEDDSIPTTSTTGSFTTDLAWARWDAQVQGSVTFNNIEMINPELTVWRGSGGQQDHPGLILPDLSDINGNGLNVEFCAGFQLDAIFVSGTASTEACVQWSRPGVVIGAINTGGSIASGDYNDITVKSTTVTGYAWSNFEEEQTVFLNGVEVVAQGGMNVLTADVVVPGNVMHDFGTGDNQDAVISVIGYFDNGAETIDLEGTIPVNLSGSGFTLEEILISFSKEGQQDAGDTVVSLRFDAECDVVIKGNHFPLDVYIGYKHAEDSSITVGLSATGTASAQPSGTMDFVNLVPSGDFEPTNASLVDGSFDQRLPSNDFTDGGFEHSTDPGNLVANGDLEAHMDDNVLVGGDFEGGASGNLLANGDFEDDNPLINAGFDDNGGGLMGWSSNANGISAAFKTGTAVGPDDTGTTVAVISNAGAAKGQFGLAQAIPNQFVGYKIQLSAWVKSNNSNTANFHVALQSSNCTQAINYVGATVQAAGQWQQATVSATVSDGCKELAAILVPEDGNTSVLVDDVEFSIVTPKAGDGYSVAGVARPNVLGTFDSSSPAPLMPGYSSGVSLATDVPGTLRTDGMQSWMFLDSASGSTNGDFDVSYKVMIKDTTSREIADFGFWLDGNYSSMKGYCFRLQTFSSDGGFFSCNTTNKSPVSGTPTVPAVQPGHWYQVRLTAVLTLVTASVWDMTDDTAFVTMTAAMPSYGSGVFGQVPDGVKSSDGIRWDDIQFNSLMGPMSANARSKTPSQVWLGNGAHGGLGRGSLYTTSWANVPFECSTGEVPTASSTYTYSTWLRAATGTVSGTLSLAATGGHNDEVISAPFTVGSSWTQVATTLKVYNGDHTDLRPRITITTGNAELQVDDQVLQQVPMWPYNSSGTVQVVSSDAHSGANSALLIAGGTGSSILWDTGSVPEAGSVVTASAWVKSPAGVAGTFRLQEQSAQSSSVNFTGTGTWQQITTTHTMQGNSGEVYTSFDLGGGQVGNALYVDDVVMTVTKVNSASGSLGAPAAPTGWLSQTDVLPMPSVPTSTAGTPHQQSSDPGPSAPLNVAASVNGSNVTVSWSGPASSKYPIIQFEVRTSTGLVVCQTPYYSCTLDSLSAGSYSFQVVAIDSWQVYGALSTPSNAVDVYQSVSPVVISDQGRAHSGLGSLVMHPGAGGTQLETYTASPKAGPAIGSTWRASVWVSSGSANNSQPVTVTLSAGGNTANSKVTMSATAGEYSEIAFDLPIGSSATGFVLQISYRDATGTQPIYIDDVAITEEGLTPQDPWQATNGYVSFSGIGDDSANAHSGDGYLQVKNSASTQQFLSASNNYRPKAPVTHSLSFWVRATSGSASASDIKLYTVDSNGNRLESAWSAINPTSQWQQVILSLPVTNLNAVAIRHEFGPGPGQSFLVDDIESRDVQYWSAVPSGGGGFISVVDNAQDPVDGANYLRAIVPSGGGGIGDTITVDVNDDSVNVVAGSSYTMQAYVRSTNGTPLNGTMSLAAAANGSQTDKQSVAFTAGADWTPVALDFDATKNANALIPMVTLPGAGQLDIDALTLVPEVIEQDDPWSASGNGVKFQVVGDAEQAHDHSYGVMEMTPSSAGTGIQHGVDNTTQVGEQYSATAWVRSDSGASISGFLIVTTVGSTQEQWKVPFSATGNWSQVNAGMAITQSGHTGFTLEVLSNTPGQLLYVDDVALETNPWTSTGGALSSVIFGGEQAQSGSGYLVLAPGTSQGGAAYLDMPAAVANDSIYAAGTSWTVTAYLRSVNGDSNVSGSMSLGATGDATNVNSRLIGANSSWQAVSVEFTPSTDVTALRVQIALNSGSTPVAVDSVTITQTGQGDIDGITTPLPHPESGWVYLWDDAFGVPGAHLWSVTAQVSFEDGLPGLGIGATLYQDPSKAPSVMDGTDWIKGDMAVNFSEADPCFLFGFDASEGDSGISLKQVFTTKFFSLNFAPRGCEVGPYELPMGASLSFDSQLGDDEDVHFDLAVTVGDDGPQFAENVGITNVVIAGIDFKEMELDVLMSEHVKDITFVGNVELPMGTFYGTYDLTADKYELLMDGSVSLTDWHLVGGTFNVEQFDFDMSLQVPMGIDQCANFTADTSGLMDMASKVDLSFTGNLEIDCGLLEQLHLQYDYHHGAVTEDFDLDFDSGTGILAGGVEFQFERETSWRFVFHRYTRHPYFMIALNYSMDVTSPSTAEATLDGAVSVSGGSGQVNCTFAAGTGDAWADDQCSLHVEIDVGGGHTYDADW